MKISVIVPTYRPGDYLWDCLLSLVEQTLSKDEYEVILVLNGCGEPYASQICSFLDAHLQGMHMRFIRVAEGGVSNARNVAIEAAEGEYMTFIDDDDYVSPTYLQELLETASDDTVAISNTHAFKDGEPDVFLPYRISDEFKRNSGKSCSTILSAKKYFSGPCMKLFPRSMIGTRRFDVRFRNGEDSIFMFLISDRIENVAFTSEDAVYYRRIREGSAVTSRRSLWQRIQNAMRMSWQYVRIYASAPAKYNFLFFVTRILGSVKGIFA